MRRLASLSLLILLALVVLSVAGLLGNRPPLTDPPGPVERVRVYFTRNVAQTDADAAFPELRPRTWPVPPRRLFEAVQAAARGLGWEPVSADPSRLSVRAVVTTRLWRFEDDMLVRVDPAEPGHATLFVRSSSRVGRGDLAANSRHILDLYAAVDAQIGSVPR